MIGTWLDWTFDYFTVWLIIFYLCIICYFCLIPVQLSFIHTVYMFEHLSFSYTLIRSLSDGPGFARPDIGCFFLLIRSSMRLDMLRGAGVSLYIFWYFCIFFIPVDSVVSLLHYTLLSIIIPFLYSYDILCGHLYVVLSWY